MTVTKANNLQHRMHVIARVLTGVVGVWAFVWAFAAFGIAGLHALGMDFHEAEGAVYVIGFLLFLCLFLWTIATKHLKTMAAVLVSGAVSMTACAWFVQHSVLA